MKPVRVLLLGWDGAEPGLVEPWVAQERLPVLAAGVAWGRLGRVRSTVPPLTPPAWTTMLTGVNPGRHGVYGFTRLGPGRREVPVTAADRRAPTVWQYLTAAGLRVGLFNLSASYPPEAVNGFVLPGFETPVFGPEMTHPREAFEVAMAGVRGYVHEGVDRLRGEQAAAHLRQQMRLQQGMLRRLMQEWPVDVLAVILNGIDRIHHRAWPEGRSVEEVAQAEGTAVEEIYRECDAILGDLLEEYADEQTEVVVVSDHGGGPLRGRLVLGRALEEGGFLKRREVDKSRDALVLLVKLARRVVPARVRPVLWALSGAKLRRRAEERQREEQRVLLDWEQTVAYPWGAGFAQVPVRGPEGEGGVAPEDRERVREEVAAHIRGLRDPATGEPLASRVRRGEEVYDEPRLGSVPDLVVDPGEGAWVVVPWSEAKSGPSVERFESWRDRPKGLMGVHRPWGMVATWGPAVPAGGEPPRLEMADLAPALLYLGGVAIPEGLDGRLPREVWDTGWEPEWQAPAEVVVGEAEAYSEAEEAVVARRLGDLGYM